MTIYFHPNNTQRWKEFLQVPGLCAAALFAIEILPKGQGGTLFHLLLALVYLSALIVLVASFGRPLLEHLKQCDENRADEVGPACELAAKDYRYALARLTLWPVYTMAAFLLLVAIDVLGSWITPFQVLTHELAFAKWICLLSIVLFLALAKGRLSIVLQKYSVLQDVARALPPEEPLPLYDGDSGGATVISTGPDRFLAGGMEWSWNDLTQSCIVFGKPGAGKTACVLNAFLDALVTPSGGSDLPAAGLVLDPKGDYFDRLRDLCSLRGRGKDLVIIDPSIPDTSAVWNPFDTADDELEISSRFVSAMGALGMQTEKDTFFRDYANKFIAHALKLLRETNPAGEPPSFAQLHALVSRPDVTGELLAAIETRPGCSATCRFFWYEWLEVEARLRGDVQATVTNMLDPFLRYPYTKIFAGKSTVRMDDLLASGKIAYLHMPVADREQASRFMGTLLKLEFYRQVRLSVNKARKSFFFCDEFQAYFTPSPNANGDAFFFGLSRQSNHANIIATQNLPALTMQAPKPDVVRNLLGNCQIKLFLRNTDPDTNDYASRQFGQRVVRAPASQVSDTPHSAGVVGQHGGGTQVQEEARYRAERFARLVTPAAPNALFCESLLLLTTRTKTLAGILYWHVHKPAQ